VEGLDELFARSLDHAPDREGRIAAFREVTDRGMAGEISAEESLARRISILEANRDLVDEVGREISAKLTPSVERHLAFFRENAPRIHVVSGGFEELILPTLDRMGLAPSQLSAHRFRYGSDGKILGIDSGTALARGGKAEAVRALDAKGASIWIVGDGATDLELRLGGLADRFVAYTENRHRDLVVARADSVARSMDELINLLENL
jgi:D-3-phosphoglycerate dehydrogenase